MMYSPPRLYNLNRGALGAVQLKLAYDFSQITMRLTSDRQIVPPVQTYRIFVIK